MAETDALSYLDQLGKTSKELKEASSPVGKATQEFVQKSINQMRAKAPKATGGLASSIDFEFATESGTIIVNFLADDYWDFVNSGVQGTQGGSAVTNVHGSTYSFADVAKQQSQGISFQESLKLWIQAKGLIAPDGNYDGLAYVIMRAVKRKGIKPTNFVNDVMSEKNIEAFQEAIYQAYKKMITA